MPATSGAPGAAATTTAPPRPEPWALPHPATTTPDHVKHRALPTDRRLSARTDVWLLLAAVAAVAAGVIAWQAASTPWVTLAITDTSDRLNPVFVGDVTLRGDAALVGTIAQVLAAVLAASGALWFVYGWDRGSTMPWFTNPAWALLVSLAGAAGVVLSSQLWFVWKDAAIGRARALRLSTSELRELLDLQPAPLVEIQRASGLVWFGGMMLVGLLAASIALWAYHRRS